MFNGLPSNQQLLFTKQVMNYKGCQTMPKLLIIDSSPIVRGRDREYESG
jgi:hypothetical protein